MNRRHFLSSTAAAFAALQASGQRAFAAPATGHEYALAGASSSARGWLIPRPMFWSFDNHDPRITMAGYVFSFQIFSTGRNENTYSLDAKSIHQKQEGNRWTLTCSQLATAGQQTTVPGSFEAEAVLNGDVVLLKTRAQGPDPIRTIKVRILQLPEGAAAQTGWQVIPNFQPVTLEGVEFNYPHYVSGMPVWLLGNRNSGISFSSLDVTTVPRRFCARQLDDGVEVQLISDQDAGKMDRVYAAPTWEIRRNTTLDQAIKARTNLLESKAGLKRWEDRTDVAPWARDIHLVVTLHGMHWSGFIFNDYARMLETVRWVTSRIPGKNVLFFIAGWEGRYYRMYGDSRPDERMGGAAGLHRLVQGIHDQGSHVMAMFAGNNASPRMENFAAIAESSRFAATPNGVNWSPMRGYAVDWAEIRSPGGSGPMLNPGAPGWRDHLIQQIGALNETFGFDGNFFDTQPSSENDARHNPLEGLRAIADALRSRRPDLLLATETWYDLSLGIIPMSQTLEGPNHWSRRYQRRFAHLALGEPGRGSTGVHEVGQVPYDLEDLLDTFDLPTVGIVEDTIRVAPQKVEAVIAAAKKLSKA